MQNKILALIILLLITFGANAKGYHISVHLEGVQDTTIRLARHYESSIFKIDSTYLDSKGKGILTGDSLLQQGLYKIHFNNNIHFDLIIGADQEFSVYANSSNLPLSINIKGSTESEAFQNYNKTLIDARQNRQTLSASFKSASEEEKTEIRAQLKLQDQKMLSFVETEISTNPGSMYQVFLKQTYRPPVPEPEFDKNDPKYDSLMYMHHYKFQRDNYFNNIDFTDSRNLFTPLFKSKLENYLMQVLIRPDTIAKYATILIEQAEPDKTMYQYLSSFMLNHAATSKIMGMDALFVAVADNVYLKGKATWSDSTFISKIREQAYLKRQSLIGNIAPQLQMETIDGEITSLHEIIADYTVIVFWAPSCGHCKNVIPKLYTDVYLKFIDNNIEVFSVYVEDNKNEWKKFIEEHQLAGWIHTWDPSHNTNYHVKYDVQQKPLIYLLDKDKKIIAKKIGVDNLAKMLNLFINK